MIAYLDKVLIFPKMSGYVKVFKGKIKNKNKNQKLRHLYLGDCKLLEKYKTIWTKIEDLRNNQLDALPVYDDL